MSELNLKNIRKQFAANGVFYTDRALAEMLKSYMPEGLTEVYDPTCGCGNLLAVFPDEVAKYGQELDPTQAAEAAKLPNAHIVAGDTLKEPAFMEKKFKGIVANYPFSVKWEPDDADARFSVAPCTAPPSKADWAFILHILHMLADDGIAAVLGSPGIGYRGNKEGTIRQWFVEQGYIHECHILERGHFVDTNIPTLLLIIRRTPADKVRFVDGENGKEIIVPLNEVIAKGHRLDPKHYLPYEAEEAHQNVDVWELEQSARKSALAKIRSEIEFSLLVAQMENWDASEFVEDIIALANSFRKQPTLFP